MLITSCHGSTVWLVRDPLLSHRGHAGQSTAVLPVSVALDVGVDARDSSIVTRSRAAMRRYAVRSQRLQRSRVLWVAGSELVRMQEHCGSPVRDVEHARAQASPRPRSERLLAELDAEFADANDDPRRFHGSRSRTLGRVRDE